MKRLRRGEVTMGTLIVILMTAGYLFLGIKLFPVVWENFTVRKVMNSVAEHQDAPLLTAMQLRERVMRGFQMNNVTQVEASDISVVREGDMRVLVLEYDKRVHLFGQMDVIINFSDTAEVID